MSSDNKSITLGTFRGIVNDFYALVFKVGYELSVMNNRTESTYFFALFNEVINELSTLDTVFMESLPLTLEEIFICETEVAGYDIKKLILGA